MTPEIPDHSELASTIEAEFKDAILSAFQITDKASRKQALAELKEKIIDAHQPEDFNKTLFSDIISSVREEGCT